MHVFTYQALESYDAHRVTMPVHSYMHVFTYQALESYDA